MSKTMRAKSIYRYINGFDRICFQCGFSLCVCACVGMWLNILPSRLSQKRTYVIGYDQINLSPADIRVISSVTNQLTYDKLLKLFRRALHNLYPTEQCGWRWESEKERERVWERDSVCVHECVRVWERGFVSARVNIYRYIEKTECEV